MRKTSGLLLTALLFAASPSFAGDLTFGDKESTWHSTKCTKPVPPKSVLDADRETRGNEMNALITEINAYVDVAQAYMDCVKAEAETDNATISQAITSGAQKEIAAAQADVDKVSGPLRARQK